jgi:hypothetical protein
MGNQYISIVLHIAADRAKEFEALFERDELRRWDDYTARKRFLEARLVRCNYSDLQKDGIQDYVIHVLATEEGHHEHDSDEAFKDYNQRADAFQPEDPTVIFGDVVFERRAPV